MARKFAEITYTPSIKAAQSRYGSRAQNERFEEGEEGTDNIIGPAEAEFIEARDGFYQATVNEAGWPYVQFRGGPAGFLKVLDERTIGYADFRGNVQYLSVGNLNANDRIALILMDYPNRRRLKIWARVKIVHFDEDPEILTRLEVPTYRARVERAVVLTIEAMDWNCPQHITPRFTERDVANMIIPLKKRLMELENIHATKNRSKPQIPGVIGEGPLEVIITGIRQLTPEVRAFELRRADYTDLPVAPAGSHIEVPVPFSDGRRETRAYSIASNPARQDVYEIAVRQDPDGDGGSQAIHEGYALGQKVRIGVPRNGFSLHEDDRPALLIAGGIGITPLKPMAQTMITDGRDFNLHFAARSRSLLAYRSKLSAALKSKVRFYAGDEGQRINIPELLSETKEETIIYVCGPESLIEAVRFTASQTGIAIERVQFELFSTETAAKG
jgi:ferredoxin-NADP reductase/predicted pyridoxine 5'-phosphate oxidase superfamily flavin-nucleotide-binding protein